MPAWRGEASGTDGTETRPLGVVGTARFVKLREIGNVPRIQVLRGHVEFGNPGEGVEKGGTGCVERAPATVAARRTGKVDCTSATPVGSGSASGRDLGHD
jgi:hypothetical protein